MKFYKFYLEMEAEHLFDPECFGEHVLYCSENSLPDLQEMFDNVKVVDEVEPLDPTHLQHCLKLADHAMMILTD